MAMTPTCDWTRDSPWLGPWVNCDSLVARGYHVAGFRWIDANPTVRCGDQNTADKAGESWPLGSPCRRWSPGIREDGEIVLH